MFTPSMFFHEEYQQLVVCILCVFVDKWLLSVAAVVTISQSSWVTSKTPLKLG